MRCGRCGNDNAEGNRFCGMCGAPLTAKAQPVPPVRQAPGVPATNVVATKPNTASGQGVRETNVPAVPVTQPGTATRPRPALHAQENTEPVISGPSFLGLNRPGTGSDGGWEALRASRSLDYLLEEEQESKRGWGKWVFILVALALAGGFGYLHWKQGGFDWLTAGNKPAATQPTADGAQKPADNGGAAPTSPAAGSEAGGASAVPSGTAAPNAAGTDAAGTSAGSSGTAPAPAGAGTAQSGGVGENASPAAPPNASQSVPPPTSPAISQSTPQSTASTDNPAQGDAAPNAAAAPGQVSGSQSNSIEPTAPAVAASQGAATQSPAEEQSPQPSAIAPRKAAMKPAAKPSPAKPGDAAMEAQRYIYGRGVGQDCDRGLRMLKSAADHSDTKAMISLGALYSTGATCTPRDLPTAYRYFAMGLHKEPDNQALQGDLQKLWSQMTQPERQLAIKLSQ